MLVSSAKLISNMHSRIVIVIHAAIEQSDRDIQSLEKNKTNEPKIKNRLL